MDAPKGHSVWHLSVAKLVVSLDSPFLVALAPALFALSFLLDTPFVTFADGPLAIKVAARRSIPSTLSCRQS